MSPLQSHLEMANRHLDEAQYDEAIIEFRHIADRYTKYRADVTEAFDKALARVTRPGCEATPPHPVTLELLRLERQIKA